MNCTAMSKTHMALCQSLLEHFHRKTNNVLHHLALHMRLQASSHLAQIVDSIHLDLANHLFFLQPLLFPLNVHAIFTSYVEDFSIIINYEVVPSFRDKP